MSEIFFIRYTGGETLGLDVTGKCLAWDSTALLLYILCNINMCLHPEFSPVFHGLSLKAPLRMFEELILWASPVVKSTLLLMALLEDTVILSGHFSPRTQVNLLLISQHICKRLYFV